MTFAPLSVYSQIIEINAIFLLHIFRQSPGIRSQVQMGAPAEDLNSEQYWTWPRF